MRLLKPVSDRELAAGAGGRDRDAGATGPAIVEALGVARTTASQDWRTAGAWLRRELKKGGE